MILPSVHSLRVLVHILLVGQVAAYATLSDDSLRRIPAAGPDFDIKTGSLLAPILVPRVPGTPGSLAVQQHFLDFFADQLPRWNVEYQNSTAKTPATGNADVPFANIIVTRDPPWARVGHVGRLTLVAHYDSKLSPAGFIGATDSAAPCAMILQAARNIDEALTQKWAAMEADGTGGSGLEDDVGVMILLLDGEEAFVQWTDEDSLYGARSLAETWEATAHPALSTYHSPLSSITLFLLLDLLGSAKPSIPSYFRTTHWAYQALGNIESRMRSLGLLETSDLPVFLPDALKTFDEVRGNYGILDDHIPFIRRGVEVLHIIPSPFPRVWHRIEDDGEHLDMPTVEDWAKIVTAFVGEWMELESYLPSKSKAEAKLRAKRAGASGKTEL